MVDVKVEMSLADLGELARSADLVEQGLSAMAFQLVRNDGREQTDAYLAVCEMRQAFDDLILRLKPALLL